MEREFGKELETVMANLVRRRDSGGNSTVPLKGALRRFLQQGMEQMSLKRSLEDANQDAPTKQAKISTFFAPAGQDS
jgi:hypothetical protein